MTKEAIFFLSYGIALPGWLLLIFAPRWKWSARLIGAVIIPILLAAIYIYLLITTWGSTEGGFGSLEKVALLFQNPHVVLAGWIHYLVFDLFIGCWEVRDSQNLGISHLFVIPCIVMTCLYGPIGFTMYMILRWSLKRKFVVETT